MKIVVTGASGYIGRHVVNALISMKHEVIAVDLQNIEIHEQAKFLNIDIFDQTKDIFKELGEPDAVIHLAWKDGFAHNSHAHMEMLSSHYAFIKQLLSSGLKRIAVIGSMHEVGYHEGAIDEHTVNRPLTFYGIAKNSLKDATQLLAKEYGATYYWLRAYYILGDDSHNNSVFSKITQMEAKGQEYFPFVSGKNKYDFIDIKTLAKQISCCVLQEEVTGIINCCTGEPIALSQKVNEYIANNHYKIQPKYGEFPEREYDSPAIWGDNKKIKVIMKKFK